MTSLFFKKSFLLISCFQRILGLGSLTAVGSLKMSPIGCGTWSWGNRLLWRYNKIEDNKLKDTFNYVVNNGVNWFDTADSYGTGDLNGRSEQLLGEFMNDIKSKKRLEISFCTKLAPYPWRLGSQSMLKAAEESIYRLGRPIDMLQLHWPPFLGWQEQQYLTAFGALVESGKAKQIGLSNYGPRKLQQTVKDLSTRGAKVYSNQVQFSLLSRYPMSNGLLDTCNDLGVQAIGYSALGLGLLADKYSLDNVPPGARGILFREYLPSMGGLLGELRSVARARRKTVPQVALNWCLCKGVLVLVGMRSVDQAKEDLGAVGWRLSAAEETALDLGAARCPKQLVQNSFQSS